MKLFFRSLGFTIIEMLIAILISFIILWWVSFFLVQVNNDIQESDSITRVYSALTDFTQRMNIISKDYINSSVYSQSNTWAFDVIIFSNTGSTSGFLVGVALQNSDIFTVDKSSNYYRYWKKNLFIQLLTTSQLSNIKANTGYIWSNLAIRSDSVFPSLVANQFDVMEYNSTGATQGQILDISLKLYRSYEPGSEGSDIRDMMLKKTVDLIPVNLVF